MNSPLTLEDSNDASRRSMIDPASMPVPFVAVLLIGATGLIVGSFVNLVAMRLPNDEPLVWARSRADCCDVTLSASELAPVISWLAQRGRCSRCGAKVSARHPIVELAGGAIGVWAALVSSSLPEAGITALFGWQILLIALIDAETLWLPDQLTLPLLGSGLLAAALLPDLSMVDAAVGAGAGFLLLWIVRATYRRLRGREGLGGGDPILFGAVGAWVGWLGLPSVLLWASAAALSWVGARALARRPLGSDEPLPFGPFIVIGGWLTWLYGPIGLG